MVHMQYGGTVRQSEQEDTTIQAKCMFTFTWSTSSCHDVLDPSWMLTLLDLNFWQCGSLVI